VQEASTTCIQLDRVFWRSIFRVQWFANVWWWGIQWGRE